MKNLNNLINKLKNPLILILLLGFVLRVYYSFLTWSQCKFWDSAGYVNIARYISGHGVYYQITPARPILFSLFMAGFNFISTSQFLPRMFILIFSMLAILGMYYLGRSLTDSKNVGLFSAFLTSIFYIHIFYTQRLLVDTLSFTFYIWAAYYFYKYFKKDNNKYFYIASVIVAIGFLFRITTALILLVVLIYTIVTDGTKMFKKKEYYIGAIIFLLIISPYLIWGYFQFDGFVLTKAFATNAPSNFWVGGYNVLIKYVTRFLLLIPNVWAIPIALLFVGGFVMMHECLVGLDLVKKGDKKLRGEFFLFLMFIIPLIAISFLLNHDEDRYIFNVFPAIFVLTSMATFYIYDMIKKKDKIIAISFIVIVIGFATFSQLQATDVTIKSKLSSYKEVQEAALWIKDNSNPNDIVVTHSYPQTQYYSERYSRHFPKTQVEFEQLDQTNFTYFVVSVFERSPEWVYSYPARKNLTAVKAWITSDNQPILVIYELK